MTEKLSENSGIRYIAIEGVIGSGKTTLAKRLKEKLNADLILEQFEANPFLENFYQDRKRYAFQTQMFFLVNRFKQQQDLNQGNLFTEFTVCDYIFEKDRIFAYLNLTGEELKLYESIFPLLNKNLLKPDLVVYLQSSVERLMYNIKMRSRKIERNLTRSYIEELSEAYNHFFFRYNSTPLLIINTTEIDFLNSSSDFNELFKAIFRPDRAYTEYLQPEKRNLELR
jgi:deoxyguanosine kinase